MTPGEKPLPRWLLVAAVAVFTLFALDFLYFFVDDEAIPFVFAAHLLDGRGLVYNSFEGRVEGYSDFLHVLLDSGWLALARAIGAPKVAAIFFGKAFSLACGIATIALLYVAMRRIPGVRLTGAAAGLAFAATAGPLAMWSCSSLETAFVALLASGLGAALLVRTPRGDGVALLASVLLVFARIDGFVYAGAILGAFWLTETSDRRRCILWAVALPLTTVLLSYHVWRWSYFGDWLSAPLHAKVLYKLTAGPDAVVYRPARPYVLRFLDLYGLLLALPALAILTCTALMVRASRPARPIMVAALVLGGYAAAVGDWMAGFRFFVPVLPLLALTIAVTVSSVRHPLLQRTIAAGLVLWFAAAGWAYARDYDSREAGGAWWRHPSLTTTRFFEPYSDFYERVRALVPPGTRTAFNQAGFIPFMLELDNMDDLGLCSRFVARLPTTDVIYTEPGRYSPLTNLPALRTANAYVLYRGPAFILSPTDVLRSANAGRVPERILHDRYRLRLTDARQRFALYERTGESVEPFQTHQETFLENLVHASRIERAVWNARMLHAGEFGEQLPFLAGSWQDVPFHGRLDGSIVFAAADLPVWELHLQDIVARQPTEMVLALEGSHGTQLREILHLEPSQHRELHLRFDRPLQVSRLHLEFISDNGEPGSVRVFDLRVQGQSPALARYVRHLPFPSD